MVFRVFFGKFDQEKRLRIATHDRFERRPEHGDLTGELTQRVAAGGGRLDIVDVLPMQLENLRSKLPSGAPARLLSMDSADLRLPDASYDRALLFFLLHEQPAAHRERTLSEVFRVVRPGGEIVIVDYALPRWWHPLRYVWRPLLAALEPFLSARAAGSTATQR